MTKKKIGSKIFSKFDSNVQFLCMFLTLCQIVLQFGTMSGTCKETGRLKQATCLVGTVALVKELNSGDVRLSN